MSEKDIPQSFKNKLLNALKSKAVLDERSKQLQQQVEDFRKHEESMSHVTSELLERQRELNYMLHRASSVLHKLQDTNLALSAEFTHIVKELPAPKDKNWDDTVNRVNDLFRSTHELADEMQDEIFRTARPSDFHKSQAPVAAPEVEAPPIAEEQSAPDLSDVQEAQITEPTEPSPEVAEARRASLDELFARVDAMQFEEDPAGMGEEPPAVETEPEAAAPPVEELLAQADMAVVEEPPVQLEDEAPVAESAAVDRGAEAEVAAPPIEELLAEEDTAQVEEPPVEAQEESPEIAEPAAVVEAEAEAGAPPVEELLAQEDMAVVEEPPVQLEDEAAEPVVEDEAEEETTLEELLAKLEAMAFETRTPGVGEVSEASSEAQTPVAESAAADREAEEPKPSAQELFARVADMGIEEPSEPARKPAFFSRLLGRSRRT